LCCADRGAALSQGALSRRAVLSTWTLAVSDVPLGQRRVEAPCPETPTCSSSSDDAARGGRSFAEPWTYESSLADAFSTLANALVADKFEVVENGEGYIRATASDAGTFDFFFPDDDAIVAFRAERPNTFAADQAKQLERLRKKCRFDLVPVLRNRRRLIGVVESPFDSFGPSFFEAAAELSVPTVSDLDPLAPDFKPPDQQTRKWLRETRDAARR